MSDPLTAAVAILVRADTPTAALHSKPPRRETVCVEAWGRTKLKKEHERIQKRSSAGSECGTATRGIKTTCPLTEVETRSRPGPDMRI
jgi:hypothetical protein